MNHLFGKKKEPAKKEPTATDAVTKLKEVRPVLRPIRARVLLGVLSGAYPRVARPTACPIHAETRSIPTEEDRRGAGTCTGVFQKEGQARGADGSQKEKAV